MYFTHEQIRQDLEDNFDQINEGDVQDNLRENADGYVPVYNHQIIQDWAEMPSEYNDSWKETFGENVKDQSIVNLMQVDLFNYYSDVAQEIWDQIVIMKGMEK